MFFLKSPTGVPKTFRTKTCQQPMPPGSPMSAGEFVIFFGFLNNMTQHERSGLSQRVGGNDTRAIKRERHDSPPSVIVK